MDIFVDICYGNVAPRQHREGDALITLVRSYISHTLFNFGPNFRWLREPGAHLIIWPRPRQHTVVVVHGSVELRTNNRREGGSMRVRPGRTRGCVGLSSPQWWCWSKAHRINRTSLLSADRGIYQVFTKLTSSMARVTSYVSKSIAISRFENIPGYCICPRWW